MSREQDAKVAELVMGFARTPVRIRGSINHVDCWLRLDAPENGHWAAHELRAYYGPREYTTDPAADYQVLEHVRGAWEPDRLCKMRDELEKVWWQRAHEIEQAEDTQLQVYGCTQYRPGDYSRAALAAVEKEQQHGA